MSGAAGTFAWHLEQLGEHPCCWITDREQCGLWCGHDGDHLPYVPGQYLRLPPEVHPLDVLRFLLSVWWQRGLPCPMCGQRTDDWTGGRMSYESWHVGDERRAAPVARWQFWPCRCEAREVQR
jgi:hypothetical protein